MKANDALIEKLNKLVQRFPEIRCEYEYFGDSNSHFVKVLPEEVFKSNFDYSNAEAEILLDFISKYPDESLCFVTKDDLVEINNPSFVKEGSAYAIAKKFRGEYSGDALSMLTAQGISIEIPEGKIKCEIEPTKVITSFDKISGGNNGTSSNNNSASAEFVSPDADETNFALAA